MKNNADLKCYKLGYFVDPPNREKGNAKTGDRMQDL